MVDGIVASRYLIKDVSNFVIFFRSGLINTIIEYDVNDLTKKPHVRGS